MNGLKCPACGSDDLYENSNLVKAESGDWGICRNCHYAIRVEAIAIDKEEDKNRKDS